MPAALLALLLALRAAPARAADTDFLQTGWGAGAVAGSTTSALTGWQAYDSQDGNAVAFSTGVESSTGIPHVWTQTDAGSGDSGFLAPGSLQSSTTVLGAGTAASVSLALKEAVDVVPQHLPQARQLACAVYDPDTGIIYVFGGELPDGSYTNSVLSYDPATDTLTTAPDSLPTARAGASAAYDPVSRAVYVFGGILSGGTYVGQIVKYDPVAHSVVAAGSLATGRAMTSAAYDPVTQRIYVFGGQQGAAGTDLDEAVVFNPANQSVSVSTRLPSGRFETAAAYDPASGDVLVFGGNATGTWLSDVVAFHPLGSSVTLASPLPLPRAGLSAARNPLTGRIYLYGGDDGGVPADTVFEFNPDSRLVGVRPAVLPSARTLTAAAADPASLHLYVFGGTATAGGFDDVLENVQVASGVYVSEVFDTGNISQLGALSWDPAVQSDTATTLGVSVRAGNTPTPGPTWSNGGSFAGFANAASLTPLGSSRYVQYSATFTTVNLDTSSVLDDISLAFTQTAPSATLVSSAFDSGQTGNVMRRLRWDGQFQPGTTAEFQLRTAPDDGTGHPGAWTAWEGPTSASDYYHDPGGGEAINPLHSDGVGDRFFQYRATLLSSSTLLPAVLSTVDVTVNHLPAAPTLDTLVALSTSDIQATFTDESDNETGFVLSTGTSPGATNLGASTPTADSAGTGGSQSITAGSLFPNQVYYARVRAQDASDGLLSGFSGERDIFTLAAQPTAVSVDSVYATSATLSWNASGNPGSTPYEITASTDGFQTDLSTPIAFADGLFAAATSLASLAPGTSYFWRVRAQNGNAIPSGYSLVVATATPPAPLTGLTGFGAGPSSVTWTWGTSGPAARYRVRNAADGSLIADVSATSFTAVGLATNTALGIKVQPYVASFAGALSAASTVFTRAADPVPAAAQSLDTGSIRLSWSAQGNPLGTVYEVAETTVGFPFSVSTPIALGDGFTATATTFVGLDAGTTYFWSVRAYNRDGVPSGAAPASTQTVPGLVGALTGTALGVSSISWTWTASAGPAVAGYEVVRASDGVLLASGAAVSFLQTGLSSDTASGLAVRALGGAAPGALTPATTVYTRAAPPSATAVAAVFVDSVTLDWDGQGNPASTRYEVDVATLGGPFASVSTAPGTSFTVVNLLADTTFQFRARAVNGDGLPSDYDVSVTTYVAGLLPLPVSDFRAVPLGGARILLSWTMTPTTTVARYDLFSDGATGTVDYAVLFASVAAPATSYTTPPLTPNATYTFGIRVVDARGVTEKNGTVQASALALSTAPPLSAFVESPSAGTKAWGDRLTVTAGLAYGRSADLRRVEFQFRASSSAAWRDMTAAEPAHPNPATGTPFLTLWDVTGLAPGAYELRAVARGADGTDDPAPPVTALIVDSASPDVSASLTAPGRVLARLKVYAAAPARLELADPSKAFMTTVSLSTGCIAAVSDVLTVDADPAAPLIPSSFSVAGILRDVSLQSGQTALSGGTCATLSFSHLDADGDRRVDGTETRSDNLVVASYDAADGWRTDVPSEVLPDDGVTLKGTTRHFTLFAPVSVAPPDLATVRVYPVPWRPNDGNPDTGKSYSPSDPTSGIIFDDLPADSKLSVYTVAGSLVWEAPGPAMGGLRRWDVRNGDGRDVASGVYFLVVTAPGGATRVEKLVVIR